MTKNMVALLIGAAVAAHGCAAEDADQAHEGLVSADDEVELGVSEEALVTKSLGCGQWADFPTNWVGNTTLEFTNNTAKGTIYFQFQSGVAAPEQHTVGTNPNVKTLARFFGALGTRVTYRGWKTGNTYYSCVDNELPSGAPKLRVQTW